MRSGKIIDHISYIFLLLNILLVPLFLDKNLSNFYIIPKQYVFGGLVIVNILLWVIKIVLNKKIQFTKTMIDVPIFSLAVVGLFSAIFSDGIYDSFFGRAEYFTMNFILLVLFIGFYYILVGFINTQKRWRGILDSLLIVGFLSLLVFILNAVFKIGWLAAVLGGAWNTVDTINSIFGIWAIVMFLLSFGQLMKKDLDFVRIIFSFLVGCLSLVVLVMLSFKVLWWMLLLSVGLLLVFGISFIKQVRTGWLSVLFTVLVFSAIFIIFGTPKFVQVPAPTEVSLGIKPSWSITYDALSSGVKNFFIGTGLGSFGVDFSRFRSGDFNTDAVAWSMRFNQPFSTIFSFLAEGGVLLLGSIIFLVLLVCGHVFQIWNKTRSKNEQVVHLDFNNDNLLFESFLSFVVFIILTLGLGFVFYDQVLLWAWWLFLALVVTGFSFSHRHFIVHKEFTLEDTPQYSLAFSFGLIVVVVALVMISVWGVRLYLAERYYNQAILSGDSTKAQDYIMKAMAMRPNSDVYHSALAQIYLNKAVEISKQNDPDIQEISSVMAKAVNEAKYATDLAPKSVVLWENLATMYENAAVLVPEARDWALKSLLQARDLEPTNPVHWWRLGNDYTAVANWEEATKSYNKAIELKPDYFGAYIGLSNVYEQTQKNDEAIAVYEKIVGQNNNDPETLFNYGRLLYNRNHSGDRALAEKIWLKVVDLQPNYSNALYSLGLLYETRGDKATALQYYYKVKDLNPNNKNIADKIKKLVGSSNAVEPAPTTVQIKPKK